MTPEVLGFAIRHALRVTDGVFLRDFVLRDKNTDPIDRKRFEIAAKHFVDVKRDCLPYRCRTGQGDADA